MKNVLIIGSGISGLSCAIKCAAHGMRAIILSPYPSERAQSVMAAGGINAVTEVCETGDSVQKHIEDTLKGGAYIGGESAVTGLCSHANEIIRYLEGIGTVFSVDENGRPVRRAFGGQSYKRTYFCGASTGKQIVSALVMEARRYESKDLIERRTGVCFHSALISDGICYGVLVFDEKTKALEAIYADAVVMAVGGQNALFGKTTGSTLCDGYAAGRLFMQGAVLKNLEFIQYHPTTLETSQKRILISEAVRGEGGRLYFEDDDTKKYFMEEKYGPNGNLMTRDVVSKEIFLLDRNVFLDISFKDKAFIDRYLPEVRDLCLKFGNIDISKKAIPVAPSVHFFMGGLAVHMNHETNIHNLYAIGECASMYHGANRLGGNSLLAALYSGNVAADDIAGKDSRQDFEHKTKEFKDTITKEENKLKSILDSKSPFPVMYVRNMLAETMRKHMGIVRNDESLTQGIEDVEYDLSVAEKIRYDSSVSIYSNYSLMGILTMARASLTCAKERKESRGAHCRSDFPEQSEEYTYSTLISYDDGAYRVTLDKERLYES